jgi:ABC-type multidrug transport system fused ATPase/permease subunit
MFDRRHLFEVETLKPKSVRSTLMRLWKEFHGRHLALIIVLCLGLFSTWTYVKTPALIGQAVDRYLTPYTDQSVSSAVQAAQPSQPNAAPASTTSHLSRSEALSGVGGIIVLLIVLFVAGSVATGCTCSTTCESRFSSTFTGCRSGTTPKMRRATS